MKILVACEMSGVIRDAFISRGHEAVSCDLLPSLRPGPHILGDVRAVLDDGWDMMIGHPPCQYLSNSGVWCLFKPGNEDRWQRVSEASDFFWALWGAPIEKICIENPVPHKYGMLPKYTQTIQPWQFGEDASKRTCLWLKNLPRLTPTDIIKKDRYANQTPSGQNKLGPSKDRALLRAITYQGIANAMADQWGQ